MPNNITAAPEPTTTEPTKRARPKRPNWALYLKDSAAYLHEAVALSLNVSPTQMAKQISDTTDIITRKYILRMRAARLEMGDGAAITVFEEGKRSDGSDWIIDLKSFVTFALSRNWGKKLEKFKQLGSANLSSSAPESETEYPTPSVTKPVAESPTPSAPESETKVCKAPVAFVAAFVRLLVDIAKRATEKTEPFNVDEMPGQREDLKELSSKFGLFPDCAQSTFNTYIKGLCKFLPGHKNTTFYSDLFPEKFKSP